MDSVLFYIDKFAGLFTPARNIKGLYWPEMARNRILILFFIILKKKLYLYLHYFVMGNRKILFKIHS